MSTRIIWASSHAREVWEPRIQAIQRSWSSIELSSVRQGLRKAALVFTSPDTLVSIEVAPGRFIVALTYDVARLAADAYRTNDDVTLGEMLGYPSCCCAFFAEMKVAGDYDSTWDASSDGRADGPVESNILGRWLGVRRIMHLPCSFDCASTVLLAERYASLWPQQELAWANEILSWPAEWSAVHGVAEVKYPILKLSTPTTVVDRRIVRRQGASYPAEGARGIVFPYSEQKAKMSLGATTCGGELPIELPVVRATGANLASSLWTENGFSSQTAMDNAHDMVLSQLAQSRPHGMVLDLGCGNGHLLTRVQQLYRVPVLGVEVKTIVKKAPIMTGNLRDIASLDLPLIDTILVSQRRFEEMSNLEEWTHSHARQVLVYSYDDPTFARIEHNVHAHWDDSGRQDGPIYQA
jgi:hypothetical protein